MILKVYKKSETIEKCNVLDMKEMASGVAHVCVIGDDGLIADCGSLLCITPDGVKLAENINTDFGFLLDDKGRLRVIE